MPVSLTRKLPSSTFATEDGGPTLVNSSLIQKNWLPPKASKRRKLRFFQSSSTSMARRPKSSAIIRAPYSPGLRPEVRRILGIGVGAGMDVAVAVGVDA